MDTFHIAAALNGKCDLFISADKRQKKAAKRAGLKAREIA